MRPIDLAHEKRILVAFHETRTNQRRWINKLTTEQVVALLGPRTLGRHGPPFAKRDAGRIRRKERRFITRMKCGFGCD